MRNYPSIFQAWNGITETDLGAETEDEKIARHDLWFHAPESFGVSWRGRASQFTGVSLAGQFEPETLRAGIDKRATLRRLNPEILLLTQIGYTECDPRYTDFPDNHPWWLRDAHGNRVKGWGEGDQQSYKFNLDLPEVRQHCANNCSAAMATGIWDGIMLDVWTDDQVHLDLIKRIRAAIGETAFIICNLNADISPLTIGYMNGAYMECGQGNTKSEWDRIIKALDYNERMARAPKLNCLETWYQKGRDDFALMRAVTCLSLTHSNGYALFADPNYIVAADHFHSWYRFWNPTLGQPTGNLVIGRDGMHRREFEKGVAVFNPPNNPNNKVVNLSTAKKSVVSGTIGSRFVIGSPDGGLYLNV